MSSEVEFTGRTVSLAVENASKELDLNEKTLNYAVITKGTPGIFGLFGAKKAVIKVLLQEKQIDRGRPGFDRALEPTGKATRAEAPEDLTAAALAGREALKKIADGITDGTRIVTRDEGKRVEYEIKGGKAGVLIGKRGQTLEATQYLVEKVVNRNSLERVRVSIDVGGYLAKKRQNLENLAERTAKKAKQNGKPATLGQLNAHDRRIIHLALKDDSDVITKSMGNGFLRKLVVLPKKRRSSPKRRP